MRISNLKSKAAREKERRGLKVAHESEEKENTDPSPASRVQVTVLTCSAL